MSEKSKQNGPLSGITILDLADETAGFCSKLLSDFGARVIKIEKPDGDSSREMGPFANGSPHREKSLHFFYNNAGKQGITLDIEKKRGQQIFLELVKRTDIVVETFAPGFLDKLELGFDGLTRVNPKLILVSVTGFGQTGPRSDFKSCDLVASAYGGQMCISGFPETPPLKPYGEQSFFAASLFAATGIFLALRKRAGTRRGEHIDISLQEAVSSTIEHVMVRYFYENLVSTRHGNQNQNNDFCVLPCKDGFIQLTLFQQWDTLVEWMEVKGMAEDLLDEKYKDRAFRIANRDHIVDVIQLWTRMHTVDELFEMGQLMRFPWAPVHSVKESAQSPQLKDRGFFQEAVHPETGKSIGYPGLPFRFTEGDFPPQTRAPSIGQDNRSVYKRELGLSDKELGELYRSRVI